MNLNPTTFTLIFFTFLSQVWGVTEETLSKNKTDDTARENKNTLRINGPIKRYITIYEGQNITLRCDVDGGHAPVKTWYKVSNL